MIPNTNIKCGQHVKCELTGISGLVSSIALEENGNIRVGIQPISQDNKLIDSIFSDEASVTVIDDGISAKASSFQDTEFALGQRVGDKHSDFAGTITMLIWYLNGCVQALVTSPILERGKPVATPLPADRLLALSAEDANQTTQTKTGGPISTSYARR